MKSPRDRSMILVAILSAAVVVVAAGVTSGQAFSSLVRSAEAAPVSYAADTLELPVELDDGQDASVLDRTAGRGAATEVAADESVDLSPVVVEQVKSEMARLGALPDGVPGRAQALADQVSDGSGKTLVIVFWDPAEVDGPAWTHTQVVGGETVHASDSGQVIDHVEAWIAAQAAPEQYEVILQD